MEKLASIVLALSISTGAAAQSRVPGPEEAWPQKGASFYLSIHGPMKGGAFPFAYVLARPDPKDPTAWVVQVTCGTQGQKGYTSLFEGTGRAEIGRMKAVGGTFTLPGGRGESFIFGIAEGGSLQTTVQFTDKRCPRGRADLNSGD